MYTVMIVDTTRIAMHNTIKIWISLLLMVCVTQAYGQDQRVVDIPTRPGVTQRIVVLSAQDPKAAVILFVQGWRESRRSL
jgi:hypothetical protein